MGLTEEEIKDIKQKHKDLKKGTPTMGGLLIILSVFVSTIIWAD